MFSPPVSRRSWPTTRLTLLCQIADQRDKSAWEAFARTYGPLVQQYCLRRGLQHADAFDVLQEVMLQVSQGIGDFRYDLRRGRFRNWLGTITHRAMLKHTAKAMRNGARAATQPGVTVAGDTPQRRLESSDVLDPLWTEAFHAHVYREAASRVRVEFSDEQWRAFEATFDGEVSPYEVATDLKRTVGWVYQAKSQVIRRLKDEIMYLAEDSALLNLRPG